MFLEVSMASPCSSPLYQQLQSSPLPTPSPRLFWDLEGHRLGVPAVGALGWGLHSPTLASFEWLPCHTSQFPILKALFIS